MTSHGAQTSRRPHRQSLRLSLYDLFTCWVVRRRARRDLDRLDEHLLRDIGLDRTTARSEAARYFWQD